MALWKLQPAMFFSCADSGKGGFDMRTLLLLFFYGCLTVLLCCAQASSWLISRLFPMRGTSKSDFRPFFLKAMEK
jgi:hypothetical protein